MRLFNKNERKKKSQKKSLFFLLLVHNLKCRTNIFACNLVQYILLNLKQYKFRVKKTTTTEKQKKKSVNDFHLKIYIYKSTFGTFISLKVRPIYKKSFFYYQLFYYFRSNDVYCFSPFLRVYVYVCVYQIGDNLGRLLLLAIYIFSCATHFFSYVVVFFVEEERRKILLFGKVSLQINFLSYTQTHRIIYISLQ